MMSSVAHILQFSQVDKSDGQHGESNPCGLHFSVCVCVWSCTQVIKGDLVSSTLKVDWAMWGFFHVNHKTVALINDNAVNDEHSP